LSEAALEANEVFHPHLPCMKLRFDLLVVRK